MATGVDDFPNSQTAVASPLGNAVACAGDDANELAHYSRALSVGGAGNIPVVMLGGQAVTLTLPPGLYPIRVKQVKATGLTATGVFAYW